MAGGVVRRVLTVVARRIAGRILAANWRSAFHADGGPRDEILPADAEGRRRL
jgi:hypothetical protein